MRRAIPLLAALACACQGTPLRDPTEGEIAFDPDRPELTGATEVVPPYTGNEPLVLEAQGRYVTGLDLHRKLVMRSCGGVNGVCHNQKEYPDLHTPGNFTAAIGAPCNVQPGSWNTVFDRCEPVGDRLRFENRESISDVEIGWVDLVRGPYVDYAAKNQRPPDDAPGFHVKLKAPLGGKATELYGNGLFVRTFVDEGGVKHELPFAGYNGRWWILGDRTHLLADVTDNLTDDADALIKSGIQQGDMNRNGVFGRAAGRTIALLNPGKPEESYLVGRLRGQMQGEKVPGTRMPLANQPPSIPDMLALMCWLEKLDPAKQPYNLANPIDYARCSYSANPSALNLVGQGVTFSGRIKPMLQAQCGACHGGATPQGNLDLMTEAGLFDRLMAASKQQPARKLIIPGSQDTSYLWLKISGDGSISGARMPLDPVNGGTRVMAPDDMKALEDWITAGALND